MLIQSSPPSSQKAGVRPISFVLDDRDRGSMRVVPLVIRPEDLTCNEPARVTIHQTLGTGAERAWVDSFGAGLPTINIAGHTGWRNHGGGDGLAKLEELRTLIADWHRLRAMSVAEGKDPDQVQLVFADALDNLTLVVVPQNFVLRRSRSRPLLAQYQMTLAGVSADVDPKRYALASAAGALEKNLDLLSELGLESLSDTLSRITSLAKDIGEAITGTLGVAVKQFLAVTQKVLAVVTETVSRLKGAVDTVIDAALGVAADIMQAGRNIFASINQVLAFPSYVRQRIGQVVSAFTNAFCLLRNAFRSRNQYRDYSDLYGASNCSSTAGGGPLSPLRNLNPFALLAPAQAAPIVSEAAARAASEAARIDPVLSPAPAAECERYLIAISDTAVAA